MIEPDFCICSAYQFGLMCFAYQNRLLSGKSAFRYRPPMDARERERLMNRWEAVLNALADIDHLKVVEGDPAQREEELQAELHELELRLTEDGGPEREAA